MGWGEKGRAVGPGGCGLPAPLCPTDRSVMGAAPVLFLSVTGVGGYICIYTYECAGIMSVYSEKITQPKEGQEGASGRQGLIAATCCKRRKLSRKKERVKKKKKK